jgi:hypothetical protein
MSNAVRFEVRDHATGVRLMQRLAPRWATMFCGADDACWVKARLGPGPGNVALLLRAVEQFVGDEAIGALRYELDDRYYVMWVEGGDQGRAPTGAPLDARILPSG